MLCAVHSHCGGHHVYSRSWTGQSGDYCDMALILAGLWRTQHPFQNPHSTQCPQLIQDCAAHGTHSSQPGHHIQAVSQTGGWGSQNSKNEQHLFWAILARPGPVWVSLNLRSASGQSRLLKSWLHGRKSCALSILAK